MNDGSAVTRRWFEQGGAAYAAFRPQYPDELVSYLRSVAPDNPMALDVGCGTGQLTRLLATQFAQVIGVDPSEDQIAHAVACKNVRYQCLPAEELGVEDKTVDLITAAQAAHWFNLPKFYDEARRVVKDQGVIALISYGVAQLDSDCNARFQSFYRDQIRSYWPPERQLVDSGYATIDFPFEELQYPQLEIRLEWDLSELLGYISTWSAVQNAHQQGQDGLLQKFSDDMNSLWGEADTKRSIVWPIHMRVGR
jgi:ubiquinone/menaquinone biosynthesis C-methylase UbiE